MAESASSLETDDQPESRTCDEGGDHGPPLDGVTLTALRARILKHLTTKCDRDEADDLAQGVLAAIVARRPNLRGAQLEGYAVQAATNAWRSALRKAVRDAARARDRARSPLWSPFAPSPADAMDAAETVAAAMRACLGLSQREQRLAALSIVIDGIPCHQVAEATLAPAARVRKQASRAMQQLRADPQFRSMLDVVPAATRVSHRKSVHRAEARLRSVAIALGPFRARGDAAIDALVEAARVEDWAPELVDLGNVLVGAGCVSDAAHWYDALSVIAASDCDWRGVGQMRLRQAGVVRRMGRPRQAVGLYVTVRALAEDRGDVELAWLAQFGEAQVALERGDVTVAGAQFGRLIAAIPPVLKSRTDVMASLHHDQSCHERTCWSLGEGTLDMGELLHAARLLGDALRAANGMLGVRQAEVMLANAGAMYQELGLYERSESVVTTLHRYGTAMDTREWAATSLTWIAADTRDEGMFDHWAPRSLSSPSHSRQAPEALFAMGTGEMQFGRRAQAGHTLRRGRQLSRAFGIADLETRIARRLGELQSGIRIRPTSPPAGWRASMDGVEEWIPHLCAILQRASSAAP